MDGQPNAAMVERWNGDAATHWIEYQADYDRQLAPFNDALVAAATAGPHARVLDVGCGSGTTSLALAATARTVVGLDLSAPLIAYAEQRARAAGRTNVRYLVGDAQVATFDEPFDVVVSRFGLMFFDDPVAAFANLHRAVTAAGRLVTVCWQGVDRNDWMRVPAAALAQVVPVANLGEPGQPGPFALGDRDRLVGIVTDAGWRNVDLEPIEIDVVLGARTLDDTIAFLRGNSLVRSTLEGVDPDRQRAALDAVRDALAPHLTEDGVRLPAAAWLVRAGA